MDDENRSNNGAEEKSMNLNENTLRERKRKREKLLEEM